ncbi:hypothetical protein ACFSJS_27830 [Streptomyces desertarenae]|uniref:Uncharacterized protein n=1 Tax=Streptomyces desertarenae TaxID=2666184 RepID=A0ABW4PVJ2_9ACTN
MSGFQQVDDLIGIGRNSAGQEFYLRVRVGEFACDGTDREEYVQTHRFQTAATGAEADVTDVFGTDDLEAPARDLMEGRVSWHGEDLAFRPATADGQARIHAVTGW